MPGWSRTVSYIASKLAAAGLVFVGFLIVYGGFDGYRMWELTRQFPLWECLYGYAVLYSIGVDALLRKLRNGPGKMALTVLLYMIGGYFPFLIWFPDQWWLSLIAGLYGVACALFFLAATRLFRGGWRFSAPAAILLAAGAIYVSVTDFTVTEQWTETRAADSYRAEFAHFNGQKEIPIHLDGGQSLSYRVDWRIANGGYGIYLDAKGGKYTKAPDSNAEWVQYEVEVPTTVRIVVTGDRAKGAFAVRWKITGSKQAKQIRQEE